MKTASVADLKARLSHFLRVVQKGEEVVITSHRHPVGRLIAYADDKPIAPVLPQLRSNPFRLLRGVKPLRNVDTTALLREDRDKR